MRGQTTLDFAIGMGVFLVTVAFVLSFSTGLTDPFLDGGQGHPVSADRVADTLSRGMLGDPEEPAVLDDACTTAFFGGPDPGNCNFDPSNSLDERVGLEGRPSGTEPALNVSVVGDIDGGATDVLCWDTDTETIVEAGNSECDSTDVAYRIGDTPPAGSGSVVVARRTVTIDGNDAAILVRVWS